MNNPNTPPEELQRAVHHATEQGYRLAVLNPNNYLCILRHKEKLAQINIYWNKKFTHNKRFTVQTTINHPTKGRNQLNRKGITEKELREIINNPRKHTGKGYYKKH